MWDPISTKKVGVVVYVCNPSYMGGRDRKIVASPKWKCKTLSEKETDTKRAAGVVAQVIEFLTSKPKALKIPVPPKKKERN
jgi:hypothetical protein